MSDDTAFTKTSNIPILRVADGVSNWPFWSIRLSALLDGLGLLDLVQGLEHATDADDVTFAQRRRRAHYVIVDRIDDEQLAHIAHLGDNPAAEYAELQRIHQSTDLATKFTLTKSLFTSQFDPATTSLSNHIAKMRMLKKQVTSAGVTVEDDLFAMTLLFSLPSSFDVAFSTLATMGDTLTSEGVIARIMAEDNRHLVSSPHETRVKSEALVAAAPPKDRSSNKKKYYCEHHKVWGSHSTDFCRDRARALAQDSDINKINTSAANMAIVQDPTWNEPSAFIAASRPVDINKAQMFLIDSGATDHMVSDRNLFGAGTFKPMSLPIHFGNKQTLVAVGKGDIKLGDRLVLRDALYVPGMTRNLVSVAKLLQHGLRANFTANAVELLSADNDVVGSGTLIGQLFFLNLPSFLPSLVRKPAAFSAATPQALSDTQLWHRRLGHMSVGEMQRLAKSKRVAGLDDVQLNCFEDLCSSCAVGKSHRASFPPVGIARASYAGEMFHIDLAGPERVASIGGARFVMVAVDDFSRRISVSFLSNKSQAKDAVISLLIKTATQNERPVKAIRTDQGTEWINSTLNTFLDERGIVAQRTTPYTSQQNGVAERAIRTLFDMARTLLQDAAMPQSFWAEAINFAASVRNLCPSRHSDGDTATWERNMPSVAHLRPFGCLAYAHNLPVNTGGKLAPRAREAYMLGYYPHIKAYRLWDPVKRKVFSSADVLFDETRFYGARVTPAQSETTASHRTDSSPSLGPVGAVGASEVQQNSFEEDSTSNNESLPHTVATRRRAAPARINLSSSESARSDSSAPPSDVETSSRDAETSSDELDMLPTTRGRLSLADYMTSRPAAHITQVDSIPASYADAVSCAQHDEWESAIQSEQKSLRDAGTFTLVPRSQVPPGRKVVGVRYVFTNKYDAHGNITRRKARIVAKGFSQIAGLDFTNTFAPVHHRDTLRVFLCLVALHNLECDQLDITTAFLNGDLEEEVYMNVPDGMQDASKPDHVARLHKSLYGLKQAPRAWYKKLHQWFTANCFASSSADPCFYQRRDPSDNTIFIWVLVYVDDCAVASNSRTALDTFKSELAQTFAMKDQGGLAYLLGVCITRDRTKRTLVLSQEQYIINALNKFNMSSCNSVTTPLPKSVSLRKPSEDDAKANAAFPFPALVGTVQYLASITRPDIQHAASLLGTFNAAWGSHQVAAAKHLLRYLRGTATHGLTFKP